MNAIFMTGALLLAASLALPAQSQSDGRNPRATDYKLGQVWTMKQGITVTILAIEDVPKVGRVVHVRVDKIPGQSFTAIFNRCLPEMARAEAEEARNSKDSFVGPNSDGAPKLWRNDM